MGWHAALQHRDVEYHQEDLALQHWAHTVQSRVSMSVHVNVTSSLNDIKHCCSSQAWEHWRERIKHACALKEKESKAHRHYCHQLQKHALHGWIRHIQNRQDKNKRTGTIHGFSLAVS